MRQQRSAFQKAIVSAALTAAIFIKENETNSSSGTQFIFLWHKEMSNNFQALIITFKSLFTALDYIMILST